MATKAEIEEITTRSNLEMFPDVYRKLRLNRARRAIRDRKILLGHIKYLEVSVDILQAKLSHMNND